MPHYKNDIDKQKSIQFNQTEEGLKTLSFKGRMELETTLWKTRFNGSMLAVFKYQKGII